jgi:F-box protein 9
VPSFSRSVRASDDNNDEYEPPTPSSPPPPRRPSISTAASGIPRSALEHYEKAVEKETEGNLGESLKLYRKAFRMDEGVDKSYKEKYFPHPAGDKGKRVAADTAVNNTAAHHPPPVAATSELVASFSGLSIEAVAKPSLSEEEEEGKKKFSLLASVPSELLLQILRFLALSDVSAFVRLSQVCKHLCYLVDSEERIWTEICRRTFARQIWDWKVTVSGQELFLDSSAIIEEEEGEGEAWNVGEVEEEEEVEEKRVVPVDEEELAHYNGSWREMFHLRPRLRYNGIYISTCNYHRPGGHSGTSLSWGTPVHIVTYYRYLRFYPDGTLLSLLTTHGPSEVVYAFSKSLPSVALSPWVPHVSRGRWRIDKDGRVDVETEAPNLPRYLFRMQLRVRNFKGRGGVKLVWDGFWSWNKLTDDLAVFEGRNDKPFFFSRVASLDREEGFV